LLYQVATAQIAAYDIARPLRGIFHRDKTIEVRRLAAVSIDPEARSVTTSSGSVLSADYLVLPRSPSQLLRHLGSTRAQPPALLGQ
jgi:NADH dehydrogenase